MSESLAQHLATLSKKELIQEVLYLTVYRTEFHQIEKEAMAAIKSRNRLRKRLHFQNQMRRWFHGG